MVGNRICAASLAKIKRHSPGGSSRVFKIALAVTWFMRSAGYTKTTLVCPPERVCWVKLIISRAASTRISLLGLRFLSSISFCDFSSKGQSNSSATVSGMSTHKSGCERTSTEWQLAHWLQAPAGVAFSHNQARASSSAKWYWPSPDGPCKSHACPRRESKVESC